MRAKTDAQASAHGGSWGAKVLAIAMFGGFVALAAEAAAESYVVAPSAPPPVINVAPVEPTVKPPTPSPQLSPSTQPPPPEKLVWRGLDLDGDGQDDFANPTGKDVRGCDRFGCGRFGSERDAGGRRHEGVDFDASVGQAVEAPLSGFVSKIGYAYPGDPRYRYVEITNPALRYEARVLYVDPSVSEGEAVHVGEPIGHAHSLQPRYRGITNHVHLEIERVGGPKLDATRFIAERMEPVLPHATYAQAMAASAKG